MKNYPTARLCLPGGRADFYNLLLVLTTMLITFFECRIVVCSKEVEGNYNVDNYVDNLLITFKSQGY